MLSHKINNLVKVYVLTGTLRRSWQGIGKDAPLAFTTRHAASSMASLQQGEPANQYTATYFTQNVAAKYTQQFLQCTSGNSHISHHAVLCNSMYLKLFVFNSKWKGIVLRTYLCQNFDHEQLK